MIYTEREQLTIIELKEKRDTLSYVELTSALIKRPSNVAYIERNGLLYGIVTTGHIRRSQEEQLPEVKISTKFKFIRPGEYMKARKLLRDPENRIHIIPVVSSEGRLLGDYAEEDCLLSGKYFLELLKLLRISDCAKNLRYALLKPQSDSQAAQCRFYEWKNLLEVKEVPVEVIEFKQFFYEFDGFGDIDYFIYFDRRQGWALGDLLPSKIKNLWEYLIPCFDLLHVLSDPTEELLLSLQKQGVSILTYGFEESEDGYLRRFNDRLETKLRSLGGNGITLLPQMRTDFLEELEKQFANQELPFDLDCYFQDDVYKVRDRSGTFHNVCGGKRKTVGQPQEFNHTVHILGPCTIYGSYTDDAHTIPSMLQKRINDISLPYKVENDFAPRNNRNFMLNRLLAASIKYGDIIIYYKCYKCLLPARKMKAFQNCNLTDMLKKYQPPDSWFVDEVLHCNHKVYQLIASTFYEELAPILQQGAANSYPIEQNHDIIGTLYLNLYFSDFDPSVYQTIGSIVMNCNPFTLGHRYLIEEALKRVNFLIIFVVEEDESLFSFQERFSMVCVGTADLQNVIVVPSGDFILTKLSFPEYFVKQTDEHLKENTENDIRLFAEKIAPRLGITHRFVGEEREDEVTDAYNQAMNRILPANGIQVVEIPRKQSGAELISASRVRKCLMENDLERLDKLIPASTKETLFWQTRCIGNAVDTG